MGNKESYKIYKILGKENIRSEILKEIREDCGLFYNLNIPVGLKIDIVEATKRILIPLDSDFIHIVKEGNVFSWIGELEKLPIGERNPINEEYFTIERLKRGKVTQIFGKGEVLGINDYFFSRLKKGNNMSMISLGTSGFSIAGLPFEQDIEPVKLIRISLKEIERIILNDKKKWEIFLLNFLSVLKNGQAAPYSHDFKTPQKIASALRNCLLGKEPLGWYVQGVKSEVIDNGSKLKKPCGGVFSFAIKTQHLGLITGLSQPMIDSWLSKKEKKEPPFLKEYWALARYIKIEKIIGGYKFSLSTFSKPVFAYICHELWYALYGSHAPISHGTIEEIYQFVSLGGKDEWPL